MKQRKKTAMVSKPGPRIISSDGALSRAPLQCRLENSFDELESVFDVVEKSGKAAYIRLAQDVSKCTQTEMNEGVWPWQQGCTWVYVQPRQSHESSSDYTARIRTIIKTLQTDGDDITMMLEGVKPKLQRTGGANFGDPDECLCAADGELDNMRSLPLKSSSIAAIGVNDGLLELWGRGLVEPDNISRAAFWARYEDGTVEALPYSSDWVDHRDREGMMQECVYVRLPTHLQQAFSVVATRLEHGVAAFQVQAGSLRQPATASTSEALSAAPSGLGVGTSADAVARKHAVDKGHEETATLDAYPEGHFDPVQQLSEDDRKENRWIWSVSDDFNLVLREASLATGCSHALEMRTVAVQTTYDGQHQHQVIVLRVDFLTKLDAHDFSGLPYIASADTIELEVIASDYHRNRVTVHSKDLLPYKLISPRDSDVQDALSMLRRKKDFQIVLGEAQQTIASNAWLKHHAQQSSKGLSLLDATGIGDVQNVLRLLSAGADMEAKTPEGARPLHLAARDGHSDILQILLDAGANKEAAGHEKWRPLHLAAQNGHLDSVRALLDAGADKEAAGGYGQRPLHCAAEKGHVDVVRVLLEAGADKEATEQTKRRPLHLAAEKGRVDIVRALLAAGADKEAAGVAGQRPLHLAAIWGQLDVVRALLHAGVDKEAAGDNGRRPLHLAARCGRLDVVQALLDAGVAMNAAADKKWHSLANALHIAAEKGYVGIVRALLHAGANKEAAGNYEQSPLHLAAQWGQLDVVKALLDAGADMNAAFDKDWRSLHVAAEKGHVDVVRALLDAGTDKEAAGHDKRRPLHLAAGRGYLDIVRELLHAGADKDAEAIDRLCPLHLAAQNGHLDVVRALLDAGAHVDVATMIDDMRPLHMAAEKGNVNVVRALLDAGADKEAADYGDWRPLHLAARQGNLGVVKALLRAGADRDASANDSEWPLQLAAEYRHLDIVRALLDAGADDDNFKLTNHFTSKELVEFFDADEFY